jgi:hypothetical protein
MMGKIDKAAEQEPSMVSINRLLVKRGAIAETRLVSRPVAALADGNVLVRVDDFALTANNISYALTGDVLAYWQFFPEDDVWGVVPVWGHAEVIESRCVDLPAGTRFWGYLPMASHVVIARRCLRFTINMPSPPPIRPPSAPWRRRAVCCFRCSQHPI